MVVFYSLVVATRVSIGHWPTYGNPDAGTPDVPFSPVHLVVLCLAALSILFGPVAAAILLINRPTKSAWPNSYLVASIVTLVIGALTVYLDPGGYVDWFLD